MTAAWWQWGKLGSGGGGGSAAAAPCRGGDGSGSSLAAAEARGRRRQWRQRDSVMAEPAAVAAWWQRGADPLEGGGGSLHNNCEVFFYHTILSPITRRVLF